MTDEELIARLRKYKDDLLSITADRIKALVKERDEALHFLDVAVDKSPQPLKALGKHLASLLDEDDWPTAERLLNGAVAALAAERAKVEKLREYYEAAEAYAAEKTTGNGMRLVRARAALTTEADNG